MDMEAHICPPRRGLGFLSIIRCNNGICIICGGQRHQCLYKCTRLAISRSDITANYTVFSLGLITGLFNTLFSRLCASNCTAKYRLLMELNQLLAKTQDFHTYFVLILIFLYCAFIVSDKLLYWH